MANHNLKLLDCTLRDGGYINDWKWGFGETRKIIQSLIRANIDVVEVGFLRNVEGYNPDITVCNRIEELNKLLPDNAHSTMFSAMAMRSNYDIDKLSPYNGEGIEMIRITAHDYDIEDGMSFAKDVKAKGYKLSINPINIMGYTDDRILWILDQVNKIKPYQFSIVDTFGSMKRRDLDRIVSLVDNNLDTGIRVALHLHENMSLSCCLAQNFIDKHLNRPIAIDGSLMGIGRTPGNLPIELIADYLNDYADKSYDIDYLMDAIQDYISPIRGEPKWGYTPAYFLSAKHNLHRNYAEYYLNKGDLTNRDINHILSEFIDSKKTAFDSDYADKVYNEYKNNRVDDSVARIGLEKILCNNDILVIAPGSSIVSFSKEIKEFIKNTKPIVIGVNFVPEDYDVDFAFFGNNKRFSKIESFRCKTIITSNIIDGKADYVINYNSLSKSLKLDCNSLILLLRLLKDIQPKSVTIAGADGYTDNGKDYYNSSIKCTSTHEDNYNTEVANLINKLGISVTYLTPSAYDI